MAAADLKSWIGRGWERRDVMDDRLLAAFKATLSPHLSGVEAVPPGLFWCLCPDIVEPEQLGSDGHPRLGLFTPEVGLPRRMWAGGELTCHAAFQPGDQVTKRSIIADIAMKSGKSGELCFITVNNEYRARDMLIVGERQDIVYRAAPSSTGAGALGPRSDPPAGSWQVEATPTLLFRYSALTFNGHRIHYDYPYATGVEGYAGLVVHGPLQATLLLNRATQELGRFPAIFSYRGLAPLISGQTFSVAAARETGGSLIVRAIAADGTVTMRAEAV